jgi:AcrR family transcriptional regulator
MRGLADELGLGVMTLYNYFRTKDELLDSVCGHALEPLRTEPAAGASWERQLESAIRGLHLVLADNPGVLEVFATRSVYGPTLDQVRETLLGILHAAGFPTRQAIHALGALVSYAVGFTVTERARSPKSARVDPAARFRALSPDEYPHLVAAAEEYQEYVSAAAFEYGLHHLIDALRPAGQTAGQVGAGIVDAHRETDPESGVEGSPRGQRAIRRRLVSVAGELFVRQGYRGTTTRQICEQARTTERTLFRHFTSKAGLFEATVVEPFGEFVDRWLASFGGFPADRPLDEQIHTFVRALVEFLAENRELLRLLMAAEFERDENLLGVTERISARFAAGWRILADEAGHDLMRIRDYNVEHATLAMASGVSMALGMVLLDQWVFAHDAPGPDQEAIAREVSQMILYGISGRPAVRRG